MQQRLNYTHAKYYSCSTCGSDFIAGWGANHPPPPPPSSGYKTAKLPEPDRVDAFLCISEKHGQKNCFGTNSDYFSMQTT